MKHSETIGSLAAALAGAQGELSNPPVNRTADLEKFSYRFLDLAGLCEAVRPTLAKFGLAVAQEIIAENGAVGVRTLLLHESGEWLASQPLWVGIASEPRVVGAAATYGRRYALMALLNLAGADDDTEAGEVKATGAPSGRRCATERQINKILALAHELGVSAEKVAQTARSEYGAASLDKLAKDEASLLIARLIKAVDARGSSSSDAPANGIDPAYEQASADRFERDVVAGEMPTAQITFGGESA